MTSSRGPAAQIVARIPGLEGRTKMSRSKDEDVPRSQRLPRDDAPNAYLKGSSGARADDAAAAAPGDIGPNCDAKERQEQLLDEGIEETFPASDSVSVKRIT